MKRSFVAGITILWSMTGCSSSDTVCPTNPPRVVLAPRAQEVSIGQSFTPTATALICAGTELTPFVGVWRSGDPQIATVDASSGRTTGVSRGTTFVYAQYKRQADTPGGLYDSVAVTVR